MGAVVVVVSVLVGVALKAVAGGALFAVLLPVFVAVMGTKSIGIVLVALGLWNYSRGTARTGD